MGKYNFDIQNNMKHTDSWKWDKEGALCKYPLGVADTDYPPLKEIEDAIIKKARQGNLAYGVLPDGFSEAVCCWYQKRFQSNINSSWVKYAPGLITAVKLFMDAVTRQGENVIIMPPVYFNFSLIVNRNGRKLINNTLVYEDGRYKIDFEDLEEKASDPRTTMLIFCNPHNPIGHSWSEEDVRKTAEICNRNGVFVVSDEAHSDILRNGAKHTPFVSISEETAQNSASINSPGKSFNVNGLYVSYAIIPNAKIKQAYDNAYANHHFDFSIIGCQAMIAAYQYGDQYVDELNAYVTENIHYLSNFLKCNMPEVKMISTNATYLVWLDFKAWGMSSNQLDSFFRTYDISLNRGDIYGEVGDGFMRMNVACTKKTLKEALDSLLVGYHKKVIR